LERAEYSSTNRGRGGSSNAGQSNLITLCASTVASNPDIILRQEQLWEAVPEHLKDYIRNATRRLYASGDSVSHKQIQPVALVKIFISPDMGVLDLDEFSGVTNAFLRTVHSRVDPQNLTYISLVNGQNLNSKAVASLLKDCVNLSYLNLKGCIALKNDSLPEKIVQQLTKLKYINVSYTQIGGKALALVYEHCRELETLKLAGCNFLEGLNITKMFPHPSINLISLKVRHCAITPAQLDHILESFPNLQTLDYASSTSGAFRSLRPFLNISHESQLRKLNLSNCHQLDLTRRPDLAKFFEIHPKLEHIYLSNIKVNLNHVIPTESLIKLKTIFFPGALTARSFLPTVFETARNLTYLDLSQTEITLHPDDYDLPMVFKVPNLRTLSLQDTRVSDASADLIAQIHTLRSLFLRGTVMSAVGVRIIVYSCPWLEEIDVTGCRRIELRERRTLFATLQKEFLERLVEARDTGKVCDSLSGNWYKLERFRDEDEERDGLVKMNSHDENR
jgi:Leucine-rich repeat (LRR) protein